VLKEPLTKAGVYPVPLGLRGISAVDIRDIAEAAAIALTSDDHLGKTYNLNGPDVLSGPGIAEIWSGLLRREIHYTGEDMEAFELQMRQSAPSWSAFDIRMMFQGYLERRARERGDEGLSGAGARCQRLLCPNGWAEKSLPPATVSAL
jgi:uncharacterized protein YbjT (DUF2867 family)